MSECLPLVEYAPSLWNYKVSGPILEDARLGFSPRNEAQWYSLLSDMPCEDTRQFLDDLNTSIQWLRGLAQNGHLHYCDNLEPVEQAFRPNILAYDLPIITAPGDLSGSFGIQWYSAVDLNDINTWASVGSTLVHWSKADGGPVIYSGQQADGFTLDPSLHYFYFNVTPNNSSMTFEVAVSTVLRLGDDYLYCATPQCRPRPIAPPTQIIMPGDAGHDDKMTLPPNKSRMPLANHSMPLNILRFLK